MKKLAFSLALFASVLAYSQYTLPVASPRAATEQQFSVSKIKVDYGRPFLNGRKIFGGLEPYDKVWRLGANSATLISFGQDILFGDKYIKAGTYAFYAIPKAKEWVLILNKGVGNWGAYDYKENNDVARVTVPVKTLTSKTEVFTINLTPVNASQTDIEISWDDVQVKLPVKVANESAVNLIAEQLKSIKKIDSDARKTAEKK
ncbi:DUF2911 domain-containing protein [Elizabethkingia anophelis]|uniref:DUF2911 domain-containing protein n=1 Tax=Elizabethkingia anophelis TaxID=1117645 RepID=UPI0006677236|nr:DUF2911 domain-containing protein [Elizabethkingia anophelis]